MAENTNSLQLSQAQLEEYNALASGKITLGPVIIEWDFNPAVPQLIVTIYLKVLFTTIKIAAFTLNLAHPTITIGGTYLGVTVKITLTVDFKTQTVTYDIVAGPFQKKGSFHI